MDINTVLRPFPRTVGSTIALLLLIAAAFPALAKQTGSVDGQVVSSGNQTNPLIGAVIRVRGNSTKAVSGKGGRFVLRNVPNGPQTLVVSYLGMPTMEQAVNVIEGQSVTALIRLGHESTELEQVIVTASATGRARALNMQRNASNILNVVSADSIGNFPDKNVAEALDRVPSVSIVRNRGEGRYVTIRGIPSELNAYSIDGIALAAPRSDSRAIALDVIPADVVERLEVSKTLLPDQPADALGGAVNVVSRSAYDSAKPIAQFTVQSNYFESRGESQPHVDGALGSVFGDEDQLGVLVAFSSDNRQFDVQGQSTRLWELATDPTTGESHYLPDRIRQIDYDVDRARQGMTVNLDYRPTSDHVYFFRGAYNEFKDHGIFDRTDVEFDDRGLLSLDNNAGIVNVGDIAELGRTEIKQRIFDREERVKISAFSIGGEDWLRPLKLDYQIGHSSAEEKEIYRFESSYSLPGVTQIAFTNATGLAQDLDYTGIGADPRNPANYFFEGASDRPFVVHEDHWELALNARRDFTTVSQSYLKTGIRLRLKDKSSQIERLVSNSIPSSVTTLDRITEGTASQPFNGQAPLIDTDLRRIFNQDRDAFSVERDFVTSTAGDWRSEEDVYAFYVMGGYSPGSLEFQGGFRFERTALDTWGFSVDESTETAEQVSATNRYSELLPSLHAKYQLSDGSILRAAYSQTISRPGFEQSSATNVIDGDEIERGNPELRAAFSNNFDLSWTRYFSNSLGTVSVLAFYKDIEDPLFSSQFKEIIDGEVFEVTTYGNASSGKISGLEFEYQHEFSFLPSPFDGLGLQANIVFLDSETTLLPTPARNTPDDLRIAFPGQPDRVANVNLTYENGSLFIRVAASYHDQYLESVGNRPAADTIQQDHMQWDLSSRYTFGRGDRWTLFANVSNLNREPEAIRYRGSDRTEKYEYFSWAAQVGIEFRL